MTRATSRLESPENPPCCLATSTRDPPALQHREAGIPSLLRQGQGHRRKSSTNSPAATPRRKMSAKSAHTTAATRTSIRPEAVGPSATMAPRTAGVLGRTSSNPFTRTWNCAASCAPKCGMRAFYAAQCPHDHATPDRGPGSVPEEHLLLGLLRGPGGHADRPPRRPLRAHPEAPPRPASQILLLRCRRPERAPRQLRRLG